MALIKCKDCKKEFSTDAKRCPHCGAKKKSIGLGGWVVIGAIVAAFFNIPVSDKKSDSISKDPLSDARTACKLFSKKVLHDPDSAEFEPKDTYPAEVKDGVYHVQVNLRAKNGFGALRRIAVDCKARHEKGEWIAVGLKEID